MTLVIRELFYAANRYKKQNPDRFNVAADLLAYSALVDVLENPEKFGLAVLPTTNHKMVWETLVETGYEFELSDDFNAHIVDYLTDPYHPYAHKVMDVQVIKADVIFDGPLQDDQVKQRTTINRWGNVVVDLHIPLISLIFSLTNLDQTRLFNYHNCLLSL